MAEGSGEIIIKGGSVKLDYDDAIYPKESGKSKIHKNDGRRITRILVVDEGDRTLYDSGKHNEGLKWTVTVETK